MKIANFLGRQKDILLIEDDVNVATTMDDLLVAEGYRVSRVTGVPQALFKLLNQRFDCVLLDLKIHGGSGEEVLAFLRTSSELNRGVPVIVVSGVLNAAILERIARHVTAVIVKPFEAPRLMEKMKQVLQAHASAA